MKQIRSVLVLFAFISGCSNCDIEQQSQTTVYMFIDYTDSLNYNQLKENRSHDSIKIASVFSRAGCNAGEFRVVSISNIGEGIDETISYPVIPEDVTEFTMPYEVGIFFGRIQPLIKEHTKTTSSNLNNTKVFEPLCQKIKQMLYAPQGRKVMILYSDMLENSGAFSMYNAVSLNNTDSILGIMESQCKCKLPTSMKDIEMYVINHRDEKSDTLIRNACHFWQKIFNDRKIKKIQIGSSLELNN